MRKTIGLALIALVALVAALALVWHALGDSAVSTPSAKATAAAASPQSAHSTPASPASPASPENPPDTAALPGLPPQARNSAYPVDLEALRRRMPDNLYWTLGAPTQDESVLRARADRARRSNELYGKVLSNTASAEEIQRYYADRRRVSEDYIEFAAGVLADYRGQLPDEHIGLYELSIKLHRARLAEIPRDRDDALTRLRAKAGR